MSTNYTLTTHLDYKGRSRLARTLVSALEEATPRSTARLKDSLAEGRAEQYGAIAIFWEVPDDLFHASIDQLPKALAAVLPLESLRSDPLFENPGKNRLIFVQFKGVPLFWRVDIDIFAKQLTGTRNTT